MSGQNPKWGLIDLIERAEIVRCLFSKPNAPLDELPSFIDEGVIGYSQAVGHLVVARSRWQMED